MHIHFPTILPKPSTPPRSRCPPNPSLLLLLLTLFSILSLTQSCIPSPRFSRRNPQTDPPTDTTSLLPFPNTTIGTDGPQPPATAGNALNHVAIRVSNITATRAFYGDVLGFRFIFSFPIEGDVDDGDEGENGGGNGNGDGGGNGKGNREGETHLLTFMGFPFGDGKLGFQSGEELLGELRARDGLLEIFSAEERPPAPLPPLKHSSFQPGFSHLGISVVDINATEARLVEHAVPILKRTGVPAGENIESYFGLSEGATAKFSPSVRALFGEVILAQDPDGNLIEFSQV